LDQSVDIDLNNLSFSAIKINLKPKMNINCENSNSRMRQDYKDCDCKSNYQQLIRKQFLKIEELETELALLRSERDQLLHENEKILFDLQMISLKSGSEER